MKVIAENDLDLRFQKIENNKEKQKWTRKCVSPRASENKRVKGEKLGAIK